MQQGTTINRKQGSSPKIWLKGAGFFTEAQGRAHVFQVPTNHRHPLAQAQGGDLGATPEKKLETYVGKT